MPIFKSFERLAEVMSSSTDIADEVATAVVQQIKKFIGDEKRIQEKEALHESKNIARAEQLKQVFESWNPDFEAELDEVELDEGAVDEAKSLAFAALLVIPGLCSAE